MLVRCAVDGLGSMVLGLGVLVVVVAVAVVVVVEVLACNKG